MLPFSSSGTLTPTAPFDFSQSLRFLGIFMPGQGEQRTDGGTFVKALPLHGRALVAKVTASGSVEQPRVAYTLYSADELDTEAHTAAVERLRFYLSLDDDLHDFYAIGQTDPQFAPVLQRLYGLHQVKFMTPFENAGWAILSQRTYMNLARKVKDNVTFHFGSALEVDEVLYWTFPEPAQLLAAGETAINQVVGNARKSESLLSAARAFADVDEHWLRTGDYDAVERWLRGIKGIGEWSSSFIMIRSLGRMERLSRGEQRLVEAAQKVYGSSDIQQLAARYGHYQGYWAHYMRAA
ncbi:MAG: DNA-3-methyladenine glycosylase 2 family protein [Anaerolineae bacterium]